MGLMLLFMGAAGITVLISGSAIRGQRARYMANLPLGGKATKFKATGGIRAVNMIAKILFFLPILATIVLVISPLLL